MLLIDNEEDEEEENEDIRSDNESEVCSHEYRDIDIDV